MPTSSADGADQLTFIGKFIDKYFLRQPLWLQSLTFLIFVLLFVYGSINLMNGKYVLRGNLWVQKPASECPQHDRACSMHGQYYELYWGTQGFVTNSMGEYNVTLGFPEYAGALALGGHNITFTKDGVRVASQSVKINRMAGEFDDVTLQPGAEAAPAPAREEGELRLIPRAWAQVKPGMYRLLIEGVHLSGGPSKSAATFELLRSDGVIGLQDRGASDMPAGPIPVMGKAALDLGSNFYFPLPGDSLPITGTVRVTAPNSGVFQFLSNYQEEFPMPPQQVPGQVLQLSGTRGGSLTVRIVLSQEVKLFRKLTLLSKKDQLESELRNLGFLVRWSEPPLGVRAETNSLWTGPAVPFDVVQKLLRTAVDQEIALKQVGYRHQFKSTSNPTEIQLGSDGACEGRAWIPVGVLENAIKAKSEAEFQAVVTPVSDCSASRSSVSRSRRTTVRR